MTNPGDRRLRLEVRLGEQQATVHVSGSLDGVSVVSLAGELERLAATSLYRSVVLDTAEVAACDGTALRVLDDIRAACTRDGCEIRLANPSNAVSAARVAPGAE